MTSVLVVGANGRTGQWLVDGALRRGREVTALPRASLADFMLHAVEDKSLFQRALTVVGEPRLRRRAAGRERATHP